MNPTSILLVAGDPDQLETMKDILSAHGCGVLALSRPEQVSTLAGPENFRAVILDENPTGGNLEAIALLRERLPYATLVFLTSGRRRGEAEAAERAGAIVLHKPYQPGPLLQFVLECQKPARVLVVDDDSGVLAILNRSLSSLGFEISTAPGLASGRLALEEKNPDAVLLDLRLLDGSGLELLDYAQRLESPPLAVLITGFLGEYRREVERALEGPAYACLEKPFQTGQVAETLRKGLREKLLENCGKIMR